MFILKKTILFLLCLHTIPLSVIAYRLELITGTHMSAYLPLITTMRLKQFAQYPYLYNSNFEIEFPLVKSFAAMQDSSLVIVYDNQEIAGILTAAAMVPYEAQFNGSLKTFRDNGLEPEDYYYIAEIIIKSEFRNHGFSRLLFTALENHAKQLGFKAACLLVETHESHPLKPIEYKNLKNLWVKLGYTSIPAYILFSWDTFIGNGLSEEREHRLDYWIKQL